MSAVNVILQIGVPFLLWLLAAILVITVIVWRIWRASPRLGGLLVLVLLLGAGTFVAAKSLSPSGKYAVGGCKGPGLQSFGISDKYYELSGGVFYDVVDGERHRVGSYFKRDDQWIIQADGGGPRAEQELRFSVLGFYTILPSVEESAEDRWTAFNRRRLIPFTRPSWMPGWLE